MNEVTQSTGPMPGLTGVTGSGRITYHVHVPIQRFHSLFHGYTCTHKYQKHTHHLLGSFLPIHEALGNDARCENLISLAELLEQDAIRETEAADSDPFQHSVAAELVEYQVSGDLSRLLLVVGDDATDKVWLRGA